VGKAVFSKVRFEFVRFKKNILKRKIVFKNILKRKTVFKNILKRKTDDESRIYTCLLTCQFH